MIETGKFLQQRYRIDKQIGQGGMGAVYVATDERFGSTVAIKETLCMDDNFRKAIEREARLLNSLKHAALPRVSDHFEEDNGQFLVMEYIPGDDVAAMLENEKVSFTVPQVMKWADELLDALDYLHNQDTPVIHRDIKPQNLKINSRGQMILLDFGLAKGNPTDAGNHTAAKSIFGYSRNYASLEQIQGTGTDPRSDLYSLAATLYHLLTNTAPEDALTRAMSVLSQKPDPLVPANALNPNVPRGVAGVLMRAMDLNASERPNSATEMRQMLRENENYAYLVDGASISALPTEAHVFAQPTKLMAEGTRAESIGQNEMKTEILPANLSQPTAVRLQGAEVQTNVAAANVTAAPAQGGRGFAVAAGALSVLLLGVVAAGALYIAKPSIFGVGDDNKGVGNSNDVTVSNANTTVNSNSSLANANTATQKAESDAARSSAYSAPSTGADTNQQTDTTEHPAETVKNNKATGTNKQGTTVDLGDGTSIHVDDLEDPKDMTITTKDPNGQVRTMRVNPNTGLPPNMQDRRPPPEGFDPFPRGFEPNNMTPEQKRKLQQMIRRGVVRPPMPKPQPTQP